MKRYTCLIAFFFFVSTVICLGQYKSFAGYGGDTLSYLQENFIKHKYLYIGKPLSVLLEKLEFPIKSYISINNDEQDFHQESLGAYLQFFGRGLAGHMDDSKSVRSYSLIIYWQTPVLKDTFSYLDVNWTSACQTYYNDKIIKDVVLFYNNKCATIRGVRQCEVCDQNSVNYDVLECAKSYCNQESPNYDSVLCERNKCNPQSPLYNEKECIESKCNPTSVNYDSIFSFRYRCDTVNLPDVFILHYPKDYCEKCYCDPHSAGYNKEACAKIKSVCDPSSPSYSKEACEKSHQIPFSSP